MTELPPESPAPQEAPAEERKVTMPKWVPVLIGAVLVLLASLAVYTGFTSKVRSFGTSLTRRNAQPQTAAASGPPGEPQPGASRVLHGASGENIPEPTPMSADQGRQMRIVGSGDQVVSTLKLRSRRGFVLDVVPENADVYVNGQAIGNAGQFRREEQAYEFPAEGDYSVRLVADGYQEAEYLISADPGARDELARIKLRMVKRNAG